MVQHGSAKHVENICDALRETGVRLIFLDTTSARTKAKARTEPRRPVWACAQACWFTLTLSAAARMGRGLAGKLYFF